MTTLVLLPGMDGTGRLFTPFVRALGSELKCQVVQYPPSVADYAELEHVVRSQLPIGKPFILLGESFSGPIAISIAASRPPGLLGLVLCCTFAKCPVPYVAGLRPVAALLPFGVAPRFIANALLLGGFATPELQSALASVLSQVPPSTLRRRLVQVMSVDVTSELRRISVPVIYLQAEADRVVPKSAGSYVVAGAPGAALIAIRGPHFLLQAVPAEAAAAVQRFARPLTPPSSGQPQAALESAAHVERWGAAE